MHRSSLLVLLLLFSTLAQGAYAEGILRTRYPIILSHHWSGSGQSAFRGDALLEDGYRRLGVKQALEARGAVVYQPDKIAFASNEDRGRLLYRRCAGETLAERLCQDEGAEAVDGVERAMHDYCTTPDKRDKQYRDYEDCIQRVKLNIICHSQGCPDSRYMIAALSNRLSGRPMHEHVASWTSIAGINKGTALADLLLTFIEPCTPESCGEFPPLLTELGYSFDGEWNPTIYESLVALSRKYMTRTTDISCKPGRENCPPSFNQRYPNHPDIYYQSYSARIDWLHACYHDLRNLWALLLVFEGANDGYVSVDSQRFTSAGRAPHDPPTYVVDRGLVSGHSRRWWVRHPGVSHMGLSTDRVPGLSTTACAASGRDAEYFHFSREAFYEHILADLKAMGF